MSNTKQSTKQPTEAQMLAAVIAGNGEITHAGSLRGISFRMPVITIARVDAMAQKASKSRNQMLNMLLDVGIDAVYEHFTQEQIEELQDREARAYEALEPNNEE
jgi:predicted DNA-binding protein